MRIIYLLLFLVALSLGWTPIANAISFNNALVDAADIGNKDKVVRLLREGMNPDSRGDFDVTPLMRAAFRGHKEIAEILIESGAYVNAADVGGDTPLHLAARNGNVEMVKILLHYDAFIDVPDKEKWTPLMRAVMAKKDKVAELLIQNGASISTLNSVGDSVLVHASMTGKPNIMALLLRSKEFASIDPKQQKAAIDMAQRRGHDNVAGMISNSVKNIKRHFASGKMPASKKVGKSDAASKKLTIPAYMAANKEDKPKQRMIIPFTKARALATPEDQVIAPDKLLKIQQVAKQDEPDDEKSQVEPADEQDSRNVDDLNKILDKKDSRLKLSKDSSIDKMTAPLPTQKPKDDVKTAAAPGLPMHYSVQFGSYATREQAEFVWKNVKYKNLDLLFGQLPDITKITRIGDNFEAMEVYRLRVGKYEWQDVAKKTCINLRKRNVDCFVVEVFNKIVGQSQDSSDLTKPPVDAKKEELETTAPELEQPAEEAPQIVDPANAPLDIEPKKMKPTSDAQQADDYLYANNLQEEIDQEAPAEDLLTQDASVIEEGLPWLQEQEELPWLGSGAGEALSQKDFVPEPSLKNNTEQDYDDFYKQIEQNVKNTDQLSEAILVKDRIGHNIAQEEEEGMWLNISSFPNRATAGDYAERMFKYDESLSQLQIRLINIESPYGFSVSVRVGPIDTKGKADLLCDSVSYGGLECAVSGKPSKKAKTKPSRKLASVSSNTMSDKVWYSPGYWINLGTFSDRPEAEYYWTFLLEDNGDILGSAKHQVVDAQEHGEFREGAKKLRLGPFDAKARADQICSVLRFRNVACLVMND